MTINERAATELYVYGYPLVYCVDEIVKLTDGRSRLVPQAEPFNTFNYGRDLLGPDTDFVTPNNDTLYVFGALDMSGGPLVLHTPDTGDRYYVLQFVDAWSNNFAYVGKRPSGTAAADWLLVPHGFDGRVPADMSVIEVPSTIAVIVGRVQVDGDDDLPAVRTLQNEFTLAPAAGSTPGRGVPPHVATDDDTMLFWERLRAYVGAFPPPPGDREFLDLIEQAGLTVDAPPLAERSAELRDALREGEKQGKALIESLAGGVGGAPGSWTSALHLFDYNLDRLGPGTIDADEWKISDRKKAYTTRAVSARAGLWGNHGYEAVYELVHQDEHGDTLNGAHRYEVTFSPPPPADAFWSLTMYDAPDYHLVDNPIDRYSIGDRTPGLVVDDGSVTIFMQAEAPDDDKVANWLPTPPGNFRPVLRMYEPGPSVLDGTYPMPPIRRVD